MGERERAWVRAEVLSQGAICRRRLSVAHAIPWTPAHDYRVVAQQQPQREDREIYAQVVKQRERGNVVSVTTMAVFGAMEADYRAFEHLASQYERQHQLHRTGKRHAAPVQPTSDAQNERL